MVLTTVADIPASAQTPATSAPAQLPTPFEPTVSVRFFGDVNLVREPDGKTSFSLGQLDLFATARLSERWQFLSETIAESDSENEVKIEVERVLVQFLGPGGLRIGAGRYHTAIGYYNNAYHHGLWFQTAATRPRLFAFEDLGGLLPVHQVGLTADGPLIPAAGLRWVAELGNGGASRDHESVQVAVDQDRRKAVNLALISRPPGVPGAQLGVSLYTDKYTLSPGVTLDESILVAHAAYTQPPYEWLSEFARITRTPATGVDAVTRSWYIQGGRQFGPAMPFFRYESTKAAATDPVLATFGTERGPSVGLRLEASRAVSLKVQVDQRKLNGQVARSTIAQVAFVF